MEIKERLRIALEEKDMKPSDLSKITGITPSSISDWLNGKYTPKSDKIYLMAEALNVSPAWLMGKDVSKEWRSNPYDLIQSYIRELISKGQITDPGSIPTPILIRLNELNTRSMVEFIEAEIRKTHQEGHKVPEE